MKTALHHTHQSGSVPFVVSLSLSGLSLLGFGAHLLVGEFKADPSADAIKSWMEVLAWAAGLLLLVLHLRKELRPEPTNDRKYATKEEMKRVDENSCHRDEEHARELQRVENAFNVKHAENVQRLTALSAQLDRNWKEVIEKHDALRVDVRHDMQALVQPITNRLDIREQDAEKQFRSLAGDIGGLKMLSETTSDAVVRMHQTLENILGRIPQQPRGGAA